MTTEYAASTTQWIVVQRSRNVGDLGIGALCQPVNQLTNRALMWNRLVRPRRRSRRLGRVVFARTVNLENALSFPVVGLEIRIRDGPTRRYPRLHLGILEVYLPQPVHRGAVELTQPPDERSLAVFVDVHRGQVILPMLNWLAF